MRTLNHRIDIEELAPPSGVDGGGYKEPIAHFAGIIRIHRLWLEGSVIGPARVGKTAPRCAYGTCMVRDPFTPAFGVSPPLLVGRDDPIAEFA